MSGIALLATSTALAACGDAPDSTTNAGGSATPAQSDFKPCIVSDAGGFDDKSFNQLSYEGVQDAAKELGVEAKAVESNSENDYAPNLESLVGEGCKAIVTVGFALASATKESAKANPDLEYILIDDAADGGDDGKTFDGKPDVANIKPLLYDTAQAAFLAGYAAASYTKTGVVGTYGGQPFPTVTIFMDGFKQGVEYYNEKKSKSVKVVGWDGKEGSFTGGFDANQAATNTAAQLIDQDADVILPVGGPIYQGALTAIADSGKDVALVGVDADFYETDPKTRPVVLTSILKNMDVSTKEAILAAGEGKLDYTPYVGTLENGGVGIAPFHDFASKVSPDLQGELDTIKAGIIDGSIPVKSYLKQ
ncbi:BMP family ABC transporter substrate-binding protein [Nocardioides sp. TRM66260-LWL]|uniref:BMP family lipoprotein n=1 Tax=Nocardioides sp. TRM66260-LWL TaxID=2874478 RepID=UPI001CC6AD93|nr:BMP family ABC transporter substrate-binding protein [Nocardioides sp. TRM66260-LWL]MBZ5733256.1 BMP family ABC transporter substrate-binding protein [Nocardioides sp. TRM66260-LWL]